MTPAEHMKAARSKAGLLQAEVAKRVGIARETLSTYERGHNDPLATRFLAILEACGVKRLTIGDESRRERPARRRGKTAGDEGSAARSTRTA